MVVLFGLLFLGLSAAAQFCSEGATVYVGPYSGVNVPGSCVSSSGIAVTIDFDVCYQSSASCTQSCDTSCCTSDWESCMECTGCDGSYDSSFKIVNGSTYFYFDNDTTCSGTPGISDNTCMYTAAFICAGNFEVDFSAAAIFSGTCNSTVISSTGSTTASTGSTDSSSGDTSAMANRETSGSSQVKWGQ
jgi:hypothetical protein